MTLYMVITADKYELPVMVTEQVKDVAKMFNTSVATIHCDVSRQATKQRKYKIVRVNLEDTDV